MSDYMHSDYMHKEINLRQLWWLVLSFAVILADQISKWGIVEYVIKPALGEKTKLCFFRWYMQETQLFDTVAIRVTSFFNIVMAWNTGVSFSLLNGMGAFGVYLLIAIAIVITLVFTYWLVKTSWKLNGLGCALVIGGALGNVIDRARFGAVIDFLDVHAFGYHWPAFNVADMSIVCGIGLLIIVSLFFDFGGKEGYREAHDE